MYTVYSISKKTSGTDEVLKTENFKEAQLYVDHRMDDKDNDYVVYDHEGVVIYDTISHSFGNYGVMGC